VKAGAEKLNQKIVPPPAGRSEARCGFCRPGTNFLAYTSVAVQCWLRAGYLSPYSYLVNTSGAVRVYPPAVYCLEGRMPAKIVTSLCTLLSVLALVIYYWRSSLTVILCFYLIN